MSKIVILQQDVPVWAQATYQEAVEFLVPRITDFCCTQFEYRWRYWDIPDDLPHQSILGKIPHAIKFEDDEDATFFLLGFK